LCMLRAAGNFATHLTAAQSRADRLVRAVIVRVLILGGDLSTEAHGAPAGPTVSKRHVSEWPQRRIIPRGALDREQRASVEDARGDLSPGALERHSASAVAAMKTRRVCKMASRGAIRRGQRNPLR
jgi:hypothetical protein